MGRRLAHQPAQLRLTPTFAAQCQSLTYQFRILLLFLLFTCLSISESYAADWTMYAKRLTGESDYIRNSAIHALETDPGLPGILKSEIRSDHPSQVALALDVISALKWKRLLPDLIEISAQDKSGFSYVAMNSLIDPGNQAQLISLYHSRLLQANTAPASKVVLLDTLLRMKVVLGRDELESLLHDESPEVKSAALYYLRSRLLRDQEFSLLPLLQNVLESKTSKQLRLQALFLTSELYDSHRSRIVGLHGNCPEVPARLKGVCSFLGGHG